MKNFLSFKLIVVVLFFCSCKQNRLDVDVSKTQIDNFDIKRLEKDLFEKSPEEVVQHTPEMLNQYGDFYVRFVTDIIDDGGIRDSSYAYHLKRFLTDKDMLETYKQCRNSYSDIFDFKEAMEDAAKRFKYYFPDKHIPLFITFMSGFNYSVVYTDSVVGVGLEMYLGKENKLYKMLPPERFPNYMMVRMRKEYMLPDCIKGWMNAQFETPTNQKNDFLSHIVHSGKIMYLTDALLPDVTDSLKIGYTQKQLEWCKRNEFNMWSFFIQNKLLYTTDYDEIAKYTSEGPFTSSFDKQSPARVADWIGWQIIRAYMNNNPEITLWQLMAEENAQQILARSKYKPQK